MLSLKKGAAKMPGSSVIDQNCILELGLDPRKIKNFFDLIETGSE